MKIAISGSNGFIAKILIQKLRIANHEVIPVQRNLLHSITSLSELLSGTSVVINLAGSPILKRWTTANKNEIVRSRIDSTQQLVSAINNLPRAERPSLYLSASAIGIYSPGEMHTEKSTSFSSDFVGEVVKSWERSSSELNPEVRKVIFRIGLVIGHKAKTIQNILPVFRLGIGGRLGSGKQPFPFVHIQDVISAILLAIHDPEIIGIYNLVAPQQITNAQFTDELSKILNKPAFFRIPELALRIMYGEAAILLIQSPAVYPERLQNSGFKFSYPDIHSSLQEIIS